MLLDRWIVSTILTHTSVPLTLPPSPHHALSPYIPAGLASMWWFQNSGDYDLNLLRSSADR